MEDKSKTVSINKDNIDTNLSEKGKLYPNNTVIENTQEFKEYVDTTLRNNTKKYFAIIQMDIDGFKSLNSMYGEKFCDEILKYLNDKLIILLNNDKAVARITADVFGLIVPFDTMTGLRNDIAYWDMTINSYKGTGFRLKWGIYIVDDRDEPLRNMLDKAAMARQSVKGYALNNIGEYKKELGEQMNKITKIESRMFEALDNGEFVFYIQPKFDMTQNKIVGGEALIRWIEPNGHIIQPNDFIPIFERNSFVVKTDRFIWEEVCKVLHKWKVNNMPMVPISINVSRKNMFNNNFIHYLDELIEKYDVDKRYLELEITESLDETLSSSLIYELREKGYVLLMDDFGSGYSSLNTLRNTDFNVIKLDRGFLNVSMNNTRGKKIIAHTISMIKDIDLGIVAEGVETMEQALFLTGQGCAVAQGFLYCKPITVEEFEKLIVENLRICEIKETVGKAEEN